MQYGGGPLQVHAVMMIVFFFKFHSFAFSFKVSEPRMASSECISEKPSTSVELTQDDIPGAFHSRTMVELHWCMAPLSRNSCAYHGGSTRLCKGMT